MTVRAFGGLREDLAGRREVDADTVAGLTARLSEELGERFAARLRASHVAVGERRCAVDDDVPLADGDEVVLLPPFAGG